MLTFKVLVFDALIFNTLIFNVLTITFYGNVRFSLHPGIRVMNKGNIITSIIPLLTSGNGMVFASLEARAPESCEVVWARLGRSPRACFCYRLSFARLPPVLMSFDELRPRPRVPRCYTLSAGYTI